MDTINEIQATLRRDVEPVKRRDTKQLIVAEAEKLITLKGVEGLQLKDIATAIDIRPPSIYKHFKNREAVIDHIGKEYMIKFMDQFQLDIEQPIESELRQCLDSLVDMFASKPAWVRIFLYDFSVPHGLDFINKIIGPLEGQFDVGLLSGLKRRLTIWLDAGVDKGEFRQVDPEWLMNIIFGTLTLNLVWTDRTATEAALEAAEVKALKSNLFDLIYTYLSFRPLKTS
jgi:AcrR family transcriptional regulator